MNRQQIFDNVYLGLMSQGFRQSVVTFNIDTPHTHQMCKYRGEGGLKCAVGWLIPDDMYDDELEDCGGIRYNPPVIDLLKLVGITEDQVEFLAELQRCHDINKDPREMQTMLNKIAECNNLTIPQQDSSEQMIDVIDVYDQTDWGSQI